ncbi:hypothetical protein AOC36_07910 [Erysipelothrix larvae]|uniref:Uncharacterized protein n=1 Tax=Erysipelothrix larvae TaxID=1514105 RepID=A0A0X8H0N9_9FIRM|nr:hypothetical protein AOC36_07910 [Erysipelothrix larvae]
MMDTVLDKRIKSTILLVIGILLFVINEVIFKFGTIYSFIAFGIVFIVAFVTWLSNSSKS